MSKLAEKAETNTGYEDDLNLWGLEQARLLRERRWSAIDLENIAEEIESLGGSQKSEIWSRLIVLLHHLLKWEFQPDKRKYGWRSTIIEQRTSLETVISRNPSLRRYPDEILSRCYRIARMKATDETGLPEQSFPDACPYAWEQIVRSGYYPGPEEHDIV